MEFQSENLDKSARLFAVLEDKLLKMSDSDIGISDIKTVYGFNGDAYIVVECEPIGYMIYHPASGTFTETSPSSRSPYLGLQENELYYCGPTQYYKFIENEFIHTVLGYAIYDETLLAMVDHSELISEVLNSDKDDVLLDFVNNGNTEYLFSTSTLSGNSLITTMSSTSVKGSIGSDGYNWFKNLTQFGYINGGHCGFIGLNMLYAYLDKFVDDKYMPNNHWTNTTKSSLKDYNDTFSKFLYDLDPKNGTTNMHIHKVSKQYLKSEDITDINHTSRWTPFWTKETVADIIDNGYPVELFGDFANRANTGDYNQEDGYHAVVAYAYNRKGGLINTVESFIVHYGWHGYSEITLVDNLANVFGGIYAMEITNGHIHNFVNTAKWAMDGSTLYGIEECIICGVDEPIDAYQTTNIGSTEIRIDNFLPKSFTGSVIVPPILNGRIVTEIGFSAFANSSLSILSIPASVTSIGYGAFSGCSSLTSMTLPFVGESIAATGNNAKLGYIFGSTMYSGATSAYQNGVTYYVPQTLKKIDIISGKIGDSALMGFGNLESINLPSGLTSIGNYAFANCYGLESISIPSTVTSIGNNAFSCCRGLKTVNISSAITSIGNSAFAYCTGVETINFNAPALADFSSSSGIFSYLGQSGSITVNIGANVARIPAYLFDGVSKLTTVNFANNSACKSIGNYAFYDCSSLANFNFGTSSEVTNIGNYAFSGSSSLTNFNFGACNKLTDIGNYAFYNCSSLTNLNFGANSELTNIGNGAFQGCGSFVNIVIPLKVTEIGYSALLIVPD